MPDILAIVGSGATVKADENVEDMMYGILKGKWCRMMFGCAEMEEWCSLIVEEDGVSVEGS